MSHKKKGGRSPLNSGAATRPTGETGLYIINGQWCCLLSATTPVAHTEDRTRLRSTTVADNPLSTCLCPWLLPEPAARRGFPAPGQPATPVGVTLLGSVSLRVAWAERLRRLTLLPWVQLYLEETTHAMPLVSASPGHQPSRGCGCDCHPAAGGGVGRTFLHGCGSCRCTCAAC